MRELLSVLVVVVTCVTISAFHHVGNAIKEKQNKEKQVKNSKSHKSPKSGGW